MEAEKSTNYPLQTDPAAASAPPRRRGQKRKSTGGNSSAPPPTKRHARERAAAAATVAAAAAAEAAAKLAAEEVAAAAAAKEEVEAVVVPAYTNDVSIVVAEEEDLEAVEARMESEYESIRVRDRNAHVVPTPAGWFSWTRIHPVEKQTLPSFFSGKSENRTPEIYMEIRNWIMRKFHADPNTQIEVKDLSELSVGEMDARREVMEFLDHWGLINYHPFPESDNSEVNVDDKTESPNSDVLYRFEKESCLPVVARDNLTTPAAPSTLFPESTVSEELVRHEEPEYHCNSCSADCSRKRYHCQVQADYDLCTECFSSRKFDSNMSPADFILMEPADAAGVSGGKWTDQETLLLLEAVELFSENWNEIADHVATKTKAQCILHFVQMPIEEYVMNIDNENEATEKEDVGLSKTDKDTSALKDASEMSKTENDAPASKEASEMSKTGNNTPVPKDASETSNCESRADVNQLETSLMKVSVSEDGSGKKVGEETNQNIALKALNEAFEMVGSDPMPGGQFSFAEAGNPVMTLVAFLIRLAEPNVATAAARSSLKCISDNSSSIQLAARHCFLLEDPPGDKKTPAEADSVVAELVEVDALKDGELNKENKTQEISGSISTNVDVPNDQTNNDKDNDGVGNEKGACSSPNNKSTKKSKKKKKLDLNKSDKADTSKDKGTRDMKELDDSAPKTDVPKDSVVNRSNDLNQKVEMKEQGDMTEEPSQHSKSAKKENAAAGTRDLEMKEAGNEESKDNKNENQDPVKISDEPNIDKLKRAAVTAISAAAVKAKFLADQEEDQIRQLATLLIEKQLHKLETKLAFFNEMDISVTRVREQMERTKQRLYQERAQIIATRFGVPPSATRPMQQPSLPINRLAMGFASSAARPPMGMNMMMPSQRPPMARPSMTAPPPSMIVPPNTTVGFSAKPINPREN